MDNFLESILTLYIVFSLFYCVFYSLIFLLRQEKYGWKYIFKRMTYIDIIFLIIFFSAFVLTIVIVLIVILIENNKWIYEWVFKRPFIKDDDIK